MKSEIIINLTQHPATAEQVAAGVLDLPEPTAAELRRLLTFDAPPSDVEIYRRADAIAALALAEADRLRREGHEVRAAMIGGAPWFMSILERSLCDGRKTPRERLLPVYAFSRRSSVEERMPDGSVRKASVFRHAGFIPAFWLPAAAVAFCRVGRWSRCPAE